MVSAPQHKYESRKFRFVPHSLLFLNFTACHMDSTRCVSAPGFCINEIPRVFNWIGIMLKDHFLYQKTRVIISPHIWHNRWPSFYTVYNYTSVSLIRSETATRNHSHLFPINTFELPLLWTIIYDVRLRNAWESMSKGLTRLNSTKYVFWCIKYADFYYKLPLVSN